MKDAGRTCERIGEALFAAAFALMVGLLIWSFA